MELASAHALGIADVAISAVSASERQKGDRFLDSYGEFRGLLERLELGHLSEVQGISYVGISYWDHALHPDHEMLARERSIHQAMFPTVPFIWGDFAASRGIDKEAIKDQRAKRWRRSFCDRQMFWAHDHASPDIFVTRDKHYAALVGHRDFPQARICSPMEAARSL